MFVRAYWRWKPGENGLTCIRWRPTIATKSIQLLHWTHGERICQAVVKNNLESHNSSMCSLLQSWSSLYLYLSLLRPYVFLCHLYVSFCLLYVSFFLLLFFCCRIRFLFLTLNISIPLFLRRNPTIILMLGKCIKCKVKIKFVTSISPLCRLYISKEMQAINKST